MKNILIYFLVSLMFLCCESKENQFVPLFNNISFKINSGEKATKIELREKEIFNSYFDKKNNIQIPLYRCIKSEKYIIFIGIPFNTTLKELSKNKLSKNFSSPSLELYSNEYFYKTYQNNKENITIYAKNFQNNLVYILAVSNSNNKLETFFDIKTLSQRFNK
jgi:hypothetical protein